MHDAPIIYDDTKLQLLRQHAVDLLGRDVVFTCDKCDRKNRCEYVYDEYNVDGGCLEDK